MAKKLFKKLDPETFNVLSSASTIGLHLVSGILVGGVAGYFLDDWLGTAPWCFLFFVLVGIAAGFKNVYTDAKRLIASQEKRDDPKDSPEN
jgi:Uncharacterized protein conserved in bacteria